MSHELKRLMPRHFAIVEMALAGHQVKTIAEALDCTPQSVSMVLQSPLVQNELARRRKDGDFETSARSDRERVIGKARSILEEAVEKAATTQVDLLGSEDDSIRLRSSQSILDRALGKAEDNSPKLVVNIGEADIALLKLAMEESSHAKTFVLQSANRSAPEADGPSSGEAASPAA